MRVRSRNESEKVVEKEIAVLVLIVDVERQETASRICCA